MHKAKYIAGDSYQEATEYHDLAEPAHRAAAEHNERAGFMNRIGAAVFVKDEGGRYIFCNKKVEELAGIRAEELLGKTSADWVAGAAGRLLHERDLDALSGSGPTEHVEMIPSQSGNSAEFLLVRFPFRDSSGRRLLAGVGVDITAQRRAEASLRQLTRRLLRVQDEERQRIARDLHDSTAQTLCALVLKLAVIQRQTPGDARTPKLLTESLALAEQAFKEVRNLSHLLHPPSLDLVGLNGAIQWHSKQVSEITGIDVSLDLPAEFKRLPADIETALFRIFQESLENIRRHSGSPIAKVRLIQRKERVVMEVEDQGRGAPSGLLTNVDQNVDGLGVGVVGMRERLRQLGGLLEIESGGKGTRVRAIIPIPAGGSSQVHDFPASSAFSA